MKKKILVAVVTVIVLAGSVSGYLYLQASDTEYKHISNTKNSSEVSAAELEAGIDARQQEFDENDYDYPAEDKLTYIINEDGTTTPELSDIDKDMWGLIEELAPSEEAFESIREFTVYYDEEDLTDASVAAIDVNAVEWSFELNYSATDDFSELLPVIVHEFSHVLSLQDDQIISDEEESTIRDSCRRYLVEEGCLDEDTMLDNFFTEFWKDNEDYTPNTDRDENEIEQFWETRQDEYVTDYATTNPVEDLAESMTFYVLEEPVTAGTIKRQKTDFFKDYPEMVAFRKDVRQTIADFAN